MGVMKRYLEEIEGRGWAPIGDKYVCSDCFGDPAIKAFVRSHANHKSCSYCKRKSSRAIAAEIDTVMGLIAESIFTEWEYAEQSVGRDSEDGWTLADVYDTYDLVVDELGLDIENAELQDDIIHSLDNHDWCEIDPYGPRLHEYFLQNWGFFAQKVKHESRYFFTVPAHNNEFEQRNVHEILEVLGEAVDSLGLLKAWPARTVLYRARVHSPSARLNRANDLGAPPPEYAKANRMSPEGIPMFYGALQQRTALAEVANAYPKGHYVTIGKFEATRDLVLLDFTKRIAIPSPFDEASRVLRSSAFFLRGFIEDLSKPILQGGVERVEYVPTQVVTEYFRWAFPDHFGRRVDGIVYPSSCAPGGQSVVLFLTNKDSADPDDWTNQPLVLRRAKARRL